MKLTLISSFFVFNLLSAAALAGEYTPEGLYDVTHHRLVNGLEVYLKQRPGSKSTSIRLAVDYGEGDNECGKTETAHYLEHLLFSGTSKHTEEELDKLIEDNGGSWNAATYDEKTIYQIDIYSPYTDLALNTLHEIMTDSTISEENVKKTLDIITREAGGEHSWLTRFLYTLDIGKNGYDKGNQILFSEDEYCPDIEVFGDISRDDIILAFNKFYVPKNMALILVGDFDAAKVLENIKKSFGTMESIEPRHVRPSHNHSYQHQGILTGTLNPLRGNDANVYILYRIPGFHPEESFVHSLLSTYLTDALYNTIRVEKGLSYSVDVSAIHAENYGRLEMYADSSVDNMQAITDIMLEEVEKLISAPPPLEKFNRVKRGLLLSYVYAFQDNTSIANVYASLWLDMLTMDEFNPIDELVQQITPEDIHQAAVKYLSRDRAVVIHDYPALTHEQAYILIGILIVLSVYSIRRRIIQATKRS
jgi:zinc protease